MEIIRKILKILGGIFFAAVIVYIILTLVAIPLFAPMIIEKQAAKILRHTVRVRGVSLNPFLWRLKIAGFAIQGHDGGDMLGWDLLTVDASFSNFFKKICRIELIEIDGLAVRARLMDKGRVDLTDLVPPPSANSAQKNPPPRDNSGKPFPVMVDSFLLRGGRIQFNDTTVTPVFETVLSDINIDMSHFTTDPANVTDIKFKTYLDSRGHITGACRAKLMASTPELDANFSLEHYSLKAVTPYTGKFAGRAASGGLLDFKTVYKISQNKLNASHHLLIQRFKFGEKIESRDALNLPFGLALALLEDPKGRIDISLPVSGDLNDPKFQYTHLIGQTIRNFFMKLVTSPFSALGSLLGAEQGTEELGSIRFLPGKSDIPPEESKKIQSLAQILKSRPKLLLEISGGYDATLDWKAIKNASFMKEYQELRKKSSRSDYWVLQTIYQRHFGIRSLWNLTSKFRVRGGYDYENLNAELRRFLIEDAFPDRKVLSDLAATRARILWEALIKQQLDPRRVTIGKVGENQSSLGYVPTNFTLTVFETPGEENSPEKNENIEDGS